MARSSLFLLLLLLLIAAGITVMGGGGVEEEASEVEDFLKRCPQSTCGGVEVRYPFRLSSSPPSCGYRDLQLSCSGNRTVLLTLPPFGLYAIAAIDYRWGTVTATPRGPPPPCPFANLSSNPLHDYEYDYDYDYDYVYESVITVNCSRKFTPDQGVSVAGPISCLGDDGHFGYLARADQSMEVLPSYCMAVSVDRRIPHLHNSENSFVDSVMALAQRRDITLRFSYDYSTIIRSCFDCAEAGKACGFSLTRNQSFCYSSTSRPGHSNAMLITGTSIGGGLLLFSLLFVMFYVLKEPVNEKDIRLKVEKFLALYTTTKPTRYTFSGLKKITKNFKEKLGQGGFGSVYKGELPGGIPVAVKMLEKSRGEGEEFINEVATMGRIHHVNIVRLLGFCSEGTRHALVYEFMSNESLEKYIFYREAKPTQCQLSIAKLQEIALGIARGIEYLHQGCNQRILHFDIKPHNILLDHDLNPKISDFGLAKLCSKDISIITMTAARGTMGYIAPELYSRNFGTVSYKSDVYSFGMLLLDMVGGKKNLEPTIENQNDIYFPELVYDQLVKGQDLNLTLDMKEEEEEIAKKLATVALWCIQWSPMDRPSMTKVVHMLMGDLQSMQVPPKPFIPTSEQDKNTYATI